MLEITDEILNEHIDKIVRVTNSIELNKVSILVGDNGSGKSLVRKQLIFKIADKIGLDKGDNRGVVKSVSMQRRTESRPEFGALSSMMHDLSWMLTSISTYNSIEDLIDCISQERYNKSFFVIDEPEIGMSEESQLGMAKLLKSCIPYILDNSYGLLIITHSNVFVSEFKDIADFHSLGIETDYDSADLWLNRKVEPTDFYFLENWYSKLFRRIEDRMAEGNK